MRCEFCGHQARYIERVERWIVCVSCERTEWFLELLDALAAGATTDVDRLVEKHLKSPLPDTIP